MSGRWLTTAAVTGCLVMVAFALWQRSRTTQHVREFWGANQASLIQHASDVKLRSSEQDTPWQNISKAPGLVHLRATLVDDRYYQWDTIQPARTTEKRYLLQFAQDNREIELAIAPDSGRVTNIQRQQSVLLISASQQAVAEYLKQISD